MALVSPGVEITVIDESQYIPSAISTVPFVIIATKENKTISNGIAPGTRKENAGKIIGVTSQRELATLFGTPFFERSVNDTPMHGSELNEYGLMAVHSAMGIGNRAFVMRADIDLSDLKGTAIRPTGQAANGTNWLNTGTSTWGIYEFDDTLDFSEAPFVNRIPIVISDANDTQGSTVPAVPLQSIGRQGDYAITVFDNNNYVFHKSRVDNTWNQLGSANWQYHTPVVVSSLTSVSANISGVMAPGVGFLVNNVAVSIGATVPSMANLAILLGGTVPGLATINGVFFDVVDDRLSIRINNLSKSNGVSADPDQKLRLEDGSGSPLSRIGLLGTIPSNPANTAVTSTVTVNGTTWAWNVTDQRWRGLAVFEPAVVFHGGFASAPLWRRSSANPRPRNSVWINNTAQGLGVNLDVKRYNTTTALWQKVAVPVYENAYHANYNLDTSGGGLNLGLNALFAKQLPANNGNVGFKIYYQRLRGQTKVTGSQTNFILNATDQFTITPSQPGQDPSVTPPTVYTCTVGSINTNLARPQAQAFVTAVLALNIPNVAAQMEPSGAVSMMHRSGGIITLNNVTGTPVSNVGFTTSTVGVTPNVVPGSINLTNWSEAVYTYSASTPFTAPSDGKLWYWDEPTQVDIMISDSLGWRGYHNVTIDARGYDLSQTDPKGVIVSFSQPETQSDNTVLESGDLWLDTSDLENFPRLYRYHKPGKTWITIDNLDDISQNGIVFADARWDADLDSNLMSIGGVIDPVAGIFPDIVKMLKSDYVDADCPNYRLYPRGTLLFNTRRSGYNVKRYIKDYFNRISFPELAIMPLQTSTWVSELGRKTNQQPAMGKHAQRHEVIQAMKAAVDSNFEIREDGYAFNLLAAPGYPELIPNLIALNNDRSQTGFIIGDLPMTLPNNTNDILDYNNNVAINNTPFLALYYPSALSNDLAGNEIVVPASHVMLRTFLYNDQVSYQWFAPAGTRRGLVDNAINLGFINARTGLFVVTRTNMNQRDLLYENKINPLTLINGTGLVVFGQKTRAPTVASTGSTSGSGSAMDRINVARLVNYLRTVLASVANQFLFEPNDKITRDQIKQLVESLLNDLVAKRGVYDYIVVCDESNNTSDRIARNELYVDVAIEPVKAVEFVYIPIRLKNPGAIAGTQITSATTDLN